MRAVIAVLLAVCMTVFLAGCGGEPDVASLRAGVDARLAQALPAGTVELVGLERRGSQADTKAPAGETRRTVYFDAQLRLARDFNFGGWDAPGVACLVSALGAGPKGISGVTSGGNKAGDIIRAHGTALFKREGDRWIAVTSGGYRPAEAPGYATHAAPGAAAILDAMRKVVDSVPKDASPAEQAAIQQELSAAYVNIRSRLARAADGYAIAAGAEHGQYLRFARALADETKVRVVPLITRGGEENLRLLRAGKVSVALAQGDAALDAYEGKGSFVKDGPYASLRAVGSLYPEAVHVLVRADDSLTSLADLRGHKVAIGEPGSASRLTALRVLEAHGLGLKDIAPQELSIGAALVALRQKQVDVVIQVIGVPADSVRDALTDVPMRLLPLSERGIAALAGANPAYFPYTLLRGVYPNQQQDVHTVATAALLLTASDLSDSEVAALTRLVFANGNDLAARGSAQGAQVSAATALQGLPVPQHLAASKALDAMTGGVKRE